MRGGITNTGLIENSFDRPGRLIVGGTGGVGGDAFESRKSFWPNAGETGGGRVSALAATGIAGEALKFGDGGSGVGPEGSEQERDNFEVNDRGIVLSPRADRLESGDVWENQFGGLPKWVGFGVPRKPGQKAGKGIGPNRPDCRSGLEGAGVIVAGVGVEESPLREGAPAEGRFGWQWRPMPGHRQRKQEQYERNQGDCVSGLHAGMMEIGHG